MAHPLGVHRLLGRIADHPGQRFHLPTSAEEGGGDRPHRAAHHRIHTRPHRAAQGCAKHDHDGIVSHCASISHASARPACTDANAGTTVSWVEAHYEPRSKICPAAADPGPPPCLEHTHNNLAVHCRDYDHTRPEPGCTAAKTGKTITWIEAHHRFESRVCPAVVVACVTARGEHRHISENVCHAGRHSCPAGQHPTSRTGAHEGGISGHVEGCHSTTNPPHTYCSELLHDTPVGLRVEELKPAHLGEVERVDVGHIGHQPVLHEGGDRPLVQVLDVERAAGGEVLYPAPRLLRAFHSGAVVRRVAV